MAPKKATTPKKGIARPATEAGKSASTTAGDEIPVTCLEDIQKLTVAQLKGKLQGCSLKASGKKEDLILSLNLWYEEEQGRGRGPFFDASNISVGAPPVDNKEKWKKVPQKGYRAKVAKISAKDADRARVYQKKLDGLLIRMRQDGNTRIPLYRTIAADLVRAAEELQGMVPDADDDEDEGGEEKTEVRALGTDLTRTTKSEKWACTSMLTTGSDVES